MGEASNMCLGEVPLLTVVGNRQSFDCLGQVHQVICLCQQT
jgi:hypothetical protein